MLAPFWTGSRLSEGACDASARGSGFLREHFPVEPANGQAGAVLLIVFLLVFGAWAGSALLSGAIVATGHFVATGENKIVQHPDGGVIREIKVREGDKVEAGRS